MAIGGVMCALYGSGHRMARVRVERKGRSAPFISGASWEKVVEDASGCVWMTVAGVRGWCPSKGAVRQCRYSSTLDGPSPKA
jgi:hypothetical protein